MSRGTVEITDAVAVVNKGYAVFVAVGFKVRSGETVNNNIFKAVEVVFADGGNLGGVAGFYL